MPRRHAPLPRALEVPHRSRLAPEDPAYPEIMARHTAALAAGDPFYPDPLTGLWVMTAARLWQRPCCHNGCRHCPWLELERRLAADRPCTPPEEAP